MSREILFRGKCVFGDNSYIYGLPTTTVSDSKSITTTDKVYGENNYFVENWEQYTNIDDKNGEKIFEGDEVIITVDAMIGVSEGFEFKGKVVMLEGEWMVDSGDGAMSLWSETNIVELVK